MNEWISVKDRLPSDEGLYLVCFQGLARLRVYTCCWKEHSRKYMGNKFGWKSNELAKRSNILYWMPLPSPPKELINECDMS